MKKVISILMTVCMVFALSATAFAEDTLISPSASQSNFIRTAEYANQFTDVKEDAWYLENVKAAYEFGLVKGVSATMFLPDSTLTVGQAITLAARLASIYETGKADFTQGEPWYKVYVDYAVEKGMVQAGVFSDYNAPITRAQFASIFAMALPEEALQAINSVVMGDIPDVDADAAYASAVYLLYNAGILTGDNSKGTFRPDSSIRRSEVAAIVTRMADPSLRKTFTLDTEGGRPEYPYLFINTEPYTVTAKDGFDTAGFSAYICDSSDDYVLTPVNSEGIEWSVYVLDEPFTDNLRYLSQYAEADWNGTGTLVIQEGKYVYVYCSANAFTTEKVPEGAALEFTRADYGDMPSEEIVQTAYSDLISFVVQGFQDKWETMDPYEMDLSQSYRYMEDTMGFTQLDINGDGIKELIFGDHSKGYATVIYDIFTANEKGVVFHLASGGERDSFFLCGDGIIAEEGSSSAFDSILEYYTIGDGVLKKTEAPLTEPTYQEFELDSFSKYAK